jgi:putative glutamine amidotransferase
VIGFVVNERVEKDQRCYSLEASAVDAVREVNDATPFMIPPVPLDHEVVLAHLDGLYLAGGFANIYPAAYGKRAQAGDGPFDPARDSLALPLVRAACERGIPLLGVCRGCQELVVAMGGTLRRELPDTPEPDKHGIQQSARNEAEQYRLRQTITPTAGGQFARIVGTAPFKVNSLHSFLLDELGPNIQAEATAEDGSVEAVSIRDAKAFAIGVIYHPDYWVKWDTPSRKVIAAFCQAAADHAERRR